MVNYRVFQISDALFWGYSLKIDLDELDSCEEIITKIKLDLTTFLKKKNLQMLIEKVEAQTYHCLEFGKILTKTEPNSIVYLCGHCHGENCCSEGEKCTEL